MSHVWVVEVRVRSTLMNGRLGPWTQWNPKDTFTCDHNSVPAAFHGKRLALWDAREARKGAFPRKTVEYRVAKYVRAG